MSTPQNIFMSYEDQIKINDIIDKQKKELKLSFNEDFLFLKRIYKKMKKKKGYKNI